MTPDRLAYWMAVLMIALLYTISLASVLKMIEKEPNEQTKRLRALVLFAYVGAFLVYGLLSFYFSQDATHLMTFLIALTFLVIFPAVLMTASVASITASNQ